MQLPSMCEELQSIAAMAPPHSLARFPIIRLRAILMLLL